MEILDQAWARLSVEQADFFAAHIGAAAQTVFVGPSQIGILPMYANRFTVACSGLEVPGVIWPDLSRPQPDASCMLLARPSYAAMGRSAFAAIADVTIGRSGPGSECTPGVLAEGVVFNGSNGVSGSVLLTGDNRNHAVAGLRYFNEGLGRVGDFSGHNFRLGNPTDNRASLVGLESHTERRLFASITSLYRCLTMQGVPIEHKVLTAQPYTLARTLLETAIDTALTLDDKDSRKLLMRGPDQHVCGAVFKANCENQDLIVAVSQMASITDVIALAIAKRPESSDPDMPTAVAVERYYFRPDGVNLAVNYLSPDAYSMPGIAAAVTGGEICDDADPLLPTGVYAALPKILSIISHQVGLQYDDAMAAAIEKNS